LTLGPDHPDVGTSLINLADLYTHQGRDAEAEPLYRRALTIDANALGPDHIDVGRDLKQLHRFTPAKVAMVMQNHSTRDSWPYRKSGLAPTKHQ
jgi:hypothetical protein